MGRPPLGPQSDKQVVLAHWWHTKTGRDLVLPGGFEVLMPEPVIRPNTALERR